jgi:folate-dependent phosphoribosylglycinamide formyltransferase PurN
MRICWFTSGRDRDAYTLFKDVIEALDRGVIAGSIPVVFLNRDPREGEPSDMIIAYAAERSIPVETLSTKRFLTERNLRLDAGRGLFDAEVYGRLKRYAFDLIFLAGYMLILSPVLFDAFPVLNIHPSLPGAYKGTWEDVINQTIDDGARTFGAMVHLVEAALDEGAPVAYARVIAEGPLIDDLYRRARSGEAEARVRLFDLVREKEFEVETPLIVQTLSLLSRGAIQIRGRKVFSEGKAAPGGIDITAEVRRWLATRT